MSNTLQALELLIKQQDFIDNKIDSMDKQKKRLVAKQITNQKQKYSIILFMQEQLGRGSFGQCFIGYDPALCELLAIKAIKAPKKQQQGYKKAKEKYKNEIQSLSKVTNQKHSINKTNLKISNLVCVHPGTFVSDNYFYIAMEFCNGGDLQHLMERYSKGFTTSQFLLIMNDIINGYNQIRSNGMTHEDLKPENIFIKDGVFKIGDFGLSIKLKPLSNPKEKFVRGGTQPYNAPEKYSPSSELPSHKSDIFALGVIFFQMYYRQHPFYTREQWNNYLSRTVNEKAKSDERLKAIFLQGKNNLRRFQQNKIFVQFIKSLPIKNLKPAIEYQYKVLSKQNHKKLEQIFEKMLQADIQKRIDFQQLKNQLNEIDLPLINRDVLNIPTKFIPSQCIIYLQEKQEAKSLTQTYNKISEIMETQANIQLKQQAQRCVIRSRILADLQQQISRFAEKYKQETLKEISQLLLQQIILFVKSKIFQIEKKLADISEEQKANFYKNNYDSLIGLLKNHASYLRDLSNREPNKSMQKQNAQKLLNGTKKFLQNLILLGADNAYIIAAFDLYEKVLFGEEQTLKDTNKLLNCKNRIIYYKVTVAQAQQVFIQRKLKLPPFIEYQDQDQ